MAPADDEFASLVEVADELGLAAEPLPSVVRQDVPVAHGQVVSALIWGAGPPEVVLVHGGGQNAHTWDLVALHLGRPAVAIDLPGHGRSSWRDDRDYTPFANADSIATVIDQLAPDAAAVVGMSLGGLTTIRLASSRPDLVRRAVVVDVTPSVNESFAAMSSKQKGSVALVSGPRTFATREEIIERAIAASPTRPARAVARGVVHNTVQLDDGSWGWRYDLAGHTTLMDRTAELWDDVSRIDAPLMLVRGGDSAFVDDAHETELLRRVPSARVERVAGAGHAVQSDQPVVLSGLITDFLRTT